MGSFENQLLLELLELQHGAIELSEVKISAKKVYWAKGYPKKKEAFWNCEAFMWSCKIDKEKREMISSELQKILGTNNLNNLDVGSGSYCYLPSVAFDCSDKMLQFNDSAIKKVRGDLEKSWPFEDSSFTSVTAIFVLNYLSDLDFVFSEIKRILLKKGKFLAVISAKGVSDLHQNQEKQKMGLDEWKEKFLKYFGSVDVYEKEGLWFVVCS